MKKNELEGAILDLWLTTRIPLTRAHLQYHTGIDRQRLGDWLDELVVEGVLGIDVSDDGEMLYSVSGANRPDNGPQSFAEIGKGKRKRAKASRAAEPGDGGLEDLKSEILGGHAKSLVATASKTLKKKNEDDKSLLVSGGLSMFLGPLGWFYAGSLKEAAIGSAAFLLLLKIIPSFILMPILFLALPISGAAGLAYAWQHNRKGERTELLTGKDDDKES